MKRRPSLLTLLVLIGTLDWAHCGIHLSFWLDRLAYDATEIVVATEGEQIDGELVVLEGWKGTLRPGEKLHLPEMLVFTNADLRTVMGDGSLRKFYSGGDTNPPIMVSGRRLILFLKPSAAEGTNSSDLQPGSPRWTAAALFEGMISSSAWVEEGKVYTSLQPINPGPLVLWPNGMSEADIKRRALQVAYERAALEEISRITNAATRARLAATFVDSNGIYSASTAFEILSGCKASGIAILREMLSNPARTNLHDTIVSALAFARDPALVDDIRESLLQELEFWKENGPRLPLDWWDKVRLKDAPVRLCRERFGQTLERLQLVWLVRYPEFDPLVKELRDYWLSLPQLDDSLKGWSADGRRVGHSQIVEQAERVLALPK